MVYMYHSFLIHSSADGLIERFQKVLLRLKELKTWISKYQKREREKRKQHRNVFKISNQLVWSHQQN